MREADIIKALYEHYKYMSHEYACFDHFRVGTGWACERTLDFFALKCWKPYTSIAFEIKTSRADFMAELRQPEKRMAAQVIFDKFIFVTPAGLLERKDIPEECGHWSIDAEGRVKVEVQRFRGEKERIAQPGWPVIASICRRVLKQQQQQEQAK